MHLDKQETNVSTIQLLLGASEAREEMDRFDSWALDAELEDQENLSWPSNTSSPASTFLGLS